MADISAADVMKLRKMSGQGMMDCKKALAETGGDVDEAMTLLRKKGLATMEKRAGRDTSEGKIIINENDGAVAMASLCCETDFVAKSDDFAATVDVMKGYMAACDADQGGEALANTAVDGKTLAEVITDAVSKTGEKTEVGDYVKYKTNGGSVVGSYIHFNNKIGAIVELEADQAAAGNDEVKTAANDVAMHITACKPLAVDRDAVDAELVEKEKAIAAEQVKNKPENIIEKIVEGKMGKFFAENCLVDQAFVKNEDIKVGKLIEETAKKAGGSAKIKRFTRLEIS